MVPSTGDLLEGSGSGDAGQRIWTPAMEAFLDDQPATGFDSPPRALVYGDGGTATRPGGAGPQPGQQLPGQQLPGQEQRGRGGR